MPCRTDISCTPCAVLQERRRNKKKEVVTNILKMSRVKLSHESAAEAGPVIIGMLCATSMYLSNVYMQRGGGSLLGVLRPCHFHFLGCFATMCSIPHAAWLHRCPVDVCACLRCMVQLGCVCA